MRDAEADRHRPRRLSELLSDLSHQDRIRVGLERAALLDAFQDVLDRVLGAGASASCKGVSLQGATLLVEVPDSIWAQKLTLAAGPLLRELNSGQQTMAVNAVRPRLRLGGATSGQPSDDHAAGDPAARCKRCGGRSDGGEICLACTAEIDYWRNSPG